MAVTRQRLVQYKEDCSVAYQHFYKRFKDDPESEASFRKLFRQLALYICKTGFWDVQVNNIPLDTEQKKAILVDINDLFNYHNIDNYDIKTRTMLGIINLIQIADERFMEDILEVSQKQINFNLQDLLHTFKTEERLIIISKEKREKLMSIINGSRNSDL